MALGKMRSTYGLGSGIFLEQLQKMAVYQPAGCTTRLPCDHPSISRHKLYKILVRWHCSPTRSTQHLPCSTGNENTFNVCLSTQQHRQTRHICHLKQSDERETYIEASASFRPSCMCMSIWRVCILCGARRSSRPDTTNPVLKKVIRYTNLTSLFVALLSCLAGTNWFFCCCCLGFGRCDAQQKPSW